MEINLSQDDLKESLRFDLQEIERFFVGRAIDGGGHFFASYNSAIQAVFAKYGISGEVETTVEDGTILKTNIRIPTDQIYRVPEWMVQFTRSEDD